MRKNDPGCYGELGRDEEALDIYRQVYQNWVDKHGPDHKCSLWAAEDLIKCLKKLQQYTEAQDRARAAFPLALRTLGAEDLVTLSLRDLDARLTLSRDGASSQDKIKALVVLGSVFKVRRRVQGRDHPDTRELRDDLDTIRTVLELDDATFELLVE